MCWYCSGACRCTGRGVGEGVVLAGKLVNGYCLGSWGFRVWQFRSSRARDKYHNLEDDVMVKNIFNSGKHKDDVGMKIPNVPTTQSQPIESTQGTHRTISAPRPLNPKIDEGALTKQNVQQVKDHLIAEEIEKLVEGAENVENFEVDSSSLRKNDNPIVLGTRLEPRSNKESLEVEITTATQPVNVNEGEEESTEDD
nr:hypothetical protein [Tanacetum cinerariifolium]